MFGLAKKPKMMGSGRIALHVLRPLSLFGLAGAAMANWVMIIFSGLKGNFSFFDALSHFWIFVLCVFLAISELNLFKAYFANNWPVLSAAHSLAWFGLALVFIGTDVLSNMTKAAYSMDQLGRPIWRLVLAAGILSILFGFFNIIASFVYRNAKEGVNSSMVRRDGSLASGKNSVKDGYCGGNSNYSYEQKPSALNRLTRVFKGAKVDKSKISAPVGEQHDIEQGDLWSNLVRRSLIISDVTAPADSYHPANRAGHESQYSEANMSRF